MYFAETKGVGILSLARWAYQTTETRLVTNSALHDGKFDVLINVPHAASERIPELLSDTLATTFGLRGRKETRDVDVYELTAKESKLEETVSTGGYSADIAQVREVDPASYATEVKPARNAQTLDDSAAVGKLQVTEEINGSNKAVRLTWRDNGTGATQVATTFEQALDGHRTLRRGERHQQPERQRAHRVVSGQLAVGVACGRAHRDVRTGDAGLAEFEGVACHRESR
jgi:uncharacterized protein (TIGR03435 family)